MKKKLEVSFVYDPEKKTLDCDAKYNGIKDSFCAVFDECLTWETIQEFVNGFVQYLYLKEKENGNNLKP